MKVSVKQYLGENCMTMEQGQFLYNEIYPVLRSGQEVEIDFSGVRIFASLFFNYAIGQLLKDFSSDQLNKLLTFQNLNAVGSNTLELVIESAKLYYKHVPVKQPR